MTVRPRIVHVIDRLSLGGMESVALTVIEQTRTEYEHVIVCLRDVGEQAARARAAGVAVHALDKQPGKDPRAYARLWRTLRRLAPALVHTYNISAVDVAFWARLAGVRHVVHAEHGRDAADPTGANTKYRLLRRAMAPMIDCFVAVSADLERWMTGALRLPARRVRLIYNGIDTERFSPTDTTTRPPPLADLPAGTRVIATIGRLDPVKGFDTLLDAAAQLAARNDAPPVHLLIVGEGPERERLTARIDELELDSQVTLAGRRDDTPALLGAASVYVCSSIAEGIALTVLEAMACALPVVATEVGGNPELVAPNETGVLVPAGDAGALADAVAGLLAEPARAEALGRAGRERVVADFSVAAMVAGYRQLYNERLAA